jgi:hypothetical protein
MGKLAYSLLLKTSNIYVKIPKLNGLKDFKREMNVLSATPAFQAEVGGS